MSNFERARVFGLTDLIVFEPALQDGETHDVNAVGDVEFSHRVGFVRFDGFNADFKPRRDFLVAVTPRDLPQNFRFAFTERNLS